MYENNLDSVNELVNKSIKFALENMKIKNESVAGKKYTNKKEKNDKK